MEAIQQVVFEAVKRSALQNEIVRVRESEHEGSAEGLAKFLAEICDGSSEGESARGCPLREYWGTVEDGHPAYGERRDNHWRVSVEADRSGGF